MSEGRSEDLQANDFDGQCQNLSDYPVEVLNPKLRLKELTAWGCLYFQRAVQR